MFEAATQFVDIISSLQKHLLEELPSSERHQQLLAYHLSLSPKDLQPK